MFLFYALSGWGFNEKRANGSLIQGYELDGVHRKAMLHVGAVTLPVIIAVAETRPQMSGKDLSAAVAGYEIGPWVGEGSCV